MLPSDSRVSAILESIDRLSEKYQLECTQEFNRIIGEFSREEVLGYARRFFVLSKPKATALLCPVIRIELCLVSESELWRLSKRGSNSRTLESLIFEELKSRSDSLSPHVLWKIASNFHFPSVRKEFFVWLTETVNPPPLALLEVRETLSKSQTIENAERVERELLILDEGIKLRLVNSSAEEIKAIYLRARRHELDEDFLPKYLWSMCAQWFPFIF